MFNIIKSETRGDANHGWLKSRHTFSFADYYDAKRMGFRSLRVINEDRINGGTGFGTHPHRDMEIVSYVISGALEHQDTMGNKAIIYPGEVQKMSAGTGVSHSEKNHSPGEPAHFFQIWILPTEAGGTPTYGQKSFVKELAEQKLTLVISQMGRQGSLSIKQDVDVHIARLKKSETLEFPLQKNRGVWIQMVSGSIHVNGERLLTGDAVAVEDLNVLKIQAVESSEFLLFDLGE